MYWKQGIPAQVFRNESLKDIHDIIDIHNALQSKGKRQKRINDMIAKIGTR